MADIPDMDPAFWSKRKATSTLLPYAVRLAQNDQRGMIDAISCVASSSWGGFMWYTIGPYITPLFDESSPPYLNQAIILVAPSVRWGPYTPNAVARWTAAVLATPYSEVVGQNVVDALLQIAGRNHLRLDIPIGVWALLKERPSLPPVCLGRRHGSETTVVCHIRGLGDIEILKSYFLLVWSQWDCLHADGLPKMKITIKEEFGGIANRHHRKDLIERLDCILGQLDQGIDHLKQYRPRITTLLIILMKRQYEQLKEVLLEVDRSSTKASSCTPSKLILFESMLTLVGVYRT